MQDLDPRWRARFRHAIGLSLALCHRTLNPLARARAERICRSHRMSESEIQDWVDRRWEVAAAMLESGTMDETGEWQPNQDWRRGLAANRERLAAKHKPE